MIKTVQMTQPPSRKTDQLQQWEAQWGIEFNRGKCQVLHITQARTAMKIPYTMHNQGLEFVSSARYLGVDISANLKFNAHIKRITSSTKKSLGFIKRNIKCKHPGVCEAAYKTIVRPQLEYGSTVWSPCTPVTKLKWCSAELPAGL